MRMLPPLFRTLLHLLLAAPLLAQSAPLAAPGLPIPSGGVPWALDQYGGKPELVPVHHSSVALNNHKGSNVAGSLAGGLLFKPRVTSELAGLHARTTLHTFTPVFYVHMNDDPGTPDETPVWSIVRATVVKDRRVFAKIQFTQLTMNARRSDGLVPTSIEPLDDHWFRITPREPLTPGEYALTPVMKSQNVFADTIYDFTLDPALPNAADAVQP